MFRGNGEKMKPTPSSSSGGQSDYNERAEQGTRHVEPKQAKYYSPRSNTEQAQLDTLLDAGFVWEEAVTLLNLREHLYENAEMRQRVADDPRLNFVRWLYLNGEMNEGK
jgi:hypothetical protein